MDGMTDAADARAAFERALVSHAIAHRVYWECDDMQQWPSLLETVRAAKAEVLRLYDAPRAGAGEDIDRNQRIVDLVCAPGTTIERSQINRGHVVVVDGRTGLDACEKTALECFEALFAEADGGPSPGRAFIGFDPSGKITLSTNAVSPTPGEEPTMQQPRCQSLTRGESVMLQCTLAEGHESRCDFTPPPVIVYERMPSAVPLTREPSRDE